MNIGGGNAAGAILDRFSNLSYITNTATTMKRGVVHLWTIGLWQ
jgi:hypothetical protein